jgi:uncharacterized membrane protein YfcA
MGISGIVASFIGATLHHNTPGVYLKLFLGYWFLLAGIWMLTANYPESGTEPKKEFQIILSIGFIAGLLSGLLGVGGGVILVPILGIIMGLL